MTKSEWGSRTGKSLTLSGKKHIREPSPFPALHNTSPRVLIPMISAELALAGREGVDSAPQGLGKAGTTQDGTPAAFPNAGRHRRGVRCDTQSETYRTYRPP